MSGRRHVTECGCERRHCLVDGYEPSEPGCVGPCLCERPTPDPASPCGQLVSDGFGRAFQCGGRDSTGHAHPHVPTRCTCGHPITKEET